MPLPFRALTERMDRQIERTVCDLARLDDGTEIFGALDSPAAGVEVGGQFGFGSANLAKVEATTFLVRSSVAATLTETMRLTIDLPVSAGGGPYSIQKIEPDGTGWTLLRLNPA